MKKKKRKGWKPVMEKEKTARETGAQPEQEAEAQPQAEAAAKEEPITVESEPAPAQDCEAEIAALKAERDELVEFAKRQKADFLNYKRRTEMSRLDGEKDGIRDTVTHFLPVLDNLERAMEAAGEEDSPLKSGLSLVLRQMREAFEKLHVETIDPLGQPFDAETMNAVMQGTQDEGEPNTVCAVFQKGYKIENRVLRHAMVKVVAG